MMKCLVAIVPEGAEPSEQPADVEEPVIPAFPIDGPVINNVAISNNNHFIGTRSRGLAPHAMVKRIDDNAEKMLERLVSQYSGLPEKYLHDIVLSTIVAAYRLPEGTTYRIFVTESSAKLQNIVNENELYPLWENRTPSNYL